MAVKHAHTRASNLGHLALCMHVLICTALGTSESGFEVCVCVWGGGMVHL